MQILDSVYILYAWSMLSRKTNYMLNIGAEFTLDLNGSPDDRVHDTTYV